MIYLKTFLISLIFTFSNMSFAQEQIMRLIKSANNLKARGNLIESIDSTKKLLTLLPKSNVNVLYYDIAKKYGVLKMADSCFYYLNLAFNENFPIKVLSEPSFFNVINDQRWKIIEENAISKYELKNGNFNNRNLVKKLLRMHLKDQAYYFEIELIEKNFKETEFLKYPIWVAKNYINERNQAELKDIINKYGWPNPKELPGDASLGAFLVAQHCESLDEQILFYNAYKSANYHDTLSLQNLAYMEDRIRLRKGLPQKYGTQFEINEKGETIYPNVQDPKNLNKRRKSIGLKEIDKFNN